MYPYLVHSLIRRGECDFFLQNYLDGREYSLPELQAKVLSKCDGTHDEVQLSELFNKPVDLIRKFLFDFSSTGFLRMSDVPKMVVMPPLETHSPRLQEVQIEVTGKCNLWCKHCYARNHFAMTGNRTLKLHEIENLIMQMFQANIGRCFLTGGEVFTRRDAPEIIRILADNRVHVSGIFTNGTLYRDDVLSSLDDARIKTRFLVSIDGCDRASHDAIRGAGNYAKTIAFVAKVIERGFGVTVNTVAMKPNISGLFQLRKMLDSLGVYSWRLSVPREQGEMIAHKGELEPLQSDVFRVYTPQPQLYETSAPIM